MNISIYNDYVTIHDSWTITTRKEMRGVLEKIRMDYTDTSIHKRGMFGMINEWKAHNALFKAGIEVDRTQSVDLEMHQSIWMKIGYFFLSLLDNTFGVLLLSSL